MAEWRVYNELFDAARKRDRWLEIHNGKDGPVLLQLVGAQGPIGKCRITKDLDVAAASLMPLVR